jgi:hypothetical protein
VRRFKKRGGNPLVFVNKRFQTCKEREWSAGKKKKKGKPVARALRGWEKRAPLLAFVSKGPLCCERRGGVSEKKK